VEKLDNQQKIIEKIEKIVTPVVNEMGLSLVDIEYMQDGGYWYVRIYVENLNGEITLEECAAISGKIDEDVDKLIEQRFFLEVSSPGIERPLKKIEDFIRFKGEKIKVSLKHKINDKKSFEGIITECKDNIIFLEIEEENIVEIPFSEVKKANIIYEFDEI
jgi:ribosome maturation factor RimP